MNKITALLVILVLASCSFKNERSPDLSDSNLTLLEIIDAIENKLNTMEYNYESCTEQANYQYNELLNLKSNEAVLSTYEKEDLKRTVERLFKIRIKIRNRLKDLDANDEASNACVKSVRNITRAFRYLEDYIVEYLFANTSKTFTSMTGNGEYFLKNDFRFLSHRNLRSGDIILSRGNAYTSAAIARIGEDDAQFSHLTFVYKDEKGKLWTTEAHIEIGAVVAPINVHIEQGNSRSVVFRYHDYKLAHKASKAIFEKVQKQMKTGVNIEYDFGMDYTKDDRLFCSEIISQGFNYASNYTVDVPVIKTKFNKGLIPFLNAMGIGVTKENVDTFKTFSPGDIEFDHNFKLIAEWRNPNKMQDSRMKDAMLTKMFEWMETKNYMFKPSLKTSAESNAYWVVRRLPLLSRFADEKFPLNMKTGQLKLFLTLDKVGELILDELKKEQAKRKEPMTPKEMFVFLEKLRESDLKQYVTKKNDSIFHKWFRQKG